MLKIKKSAYSKSGELLFMHVNLSSRRSEFITQVDFPLQVGQLVFPDKYSVKKHKHITNIRHIPFTAEVLLIISGKLKYKIWDYKLFDKLINEGIVVKNELLILGKVGHSFQAESKVKILEIKQGPYLGKIDKLYEK